MYCYQCGKEVEEGVKYCPYCGASQTAQTNQTQTDYQPLQQEPYQGGNDDAPSTGFAFLSFFIPIVGLILFIVWNKEFPLKAKSCLHGLIAGFVTWFVIVCCMFAAIASIASEEYGNYSEFNGSYFDAVVETVPYE